MKFEANLPSYLKFGAGSFPVGGQSTPKREKPTNFYEQVQTNMQDKGPVLPSDEDPVNPFTPKPIGPVLPDRMARESAETDEYIG